MDLPREYVLLGLRFDRLQEGFVDSYSGDPALRRTVQNEPRPDPAALAARARTLLAELPASGLPADRADYLRAQLIALECAGRRLAGQPVPFVEEVEACFGVHIEPGDPQRYAAAHARLAEVLPGGGDLAERLAACRRREECSPARLEPTVHALSSELRDLVRARYGLPVEETVEYQVVTDKPWSGFNYYLGEFRSRVAINADLPNRLSQLPHLVAHESYPGHHTERCRKELGLQRRAGQLEQSVFLINTPSCLLAEGLADLGIAATVGPGWGRWAEQRYADLGLTFDGELAERVAQAMTELDRVRQDAALLLHDRGAGADEVIEYVRRWMLLPEPRARQSLRFLSDPLWRAYTTTYVEGHRLLSEWLDARPAGQPVPERFVRLLDEPLTPARIRAENAAANGAAGRPSQP